MRLAHERCHPERSEGARREIRRRAQHDTPEKPHGKERQCLHSGLVENFPARAIACVLI
jgi:hypothetical protein